MFAMGFRYLPNQKGGLKRHQLDRYMVSDGPDFEPNAADIIRV